MGVEGILQGRAFRDAQRVGDRRTEQRRILHRREVDEAGPVTELRADVLGDGQRQSGLPSPARAGERDEANVALPE
jgi:hypothetical protein